MTLLGLRESQTGSKTPPSSSDLSKNDHIRAATSCLPLPGTWLPKHSWPKHHSFIFWPFWLPELAHCALSKAPVLLQGREKEHMDLIKRTAQAQSHISTTGQGSTGGNWGWLRATQVHNTQVVLWYNHRPLQVFQARSAQDLLLQNPHKHENITNGISLPK